MLRSIGKQSEELWQSAILRLGYQFLQRSVATPSGLFYWYVRYLDMYLFYVYGPRRR